VGEKVVGYHLQHRRWLDDAMRVRDLFCASRPPEVKDRVRARVRLRVRV